MRKGKQMRYGEGGGIAEIIDCAVVQLVRLLRRVDLKDKLDRCQKEYTNTVKSHRLSLNECIHRD